MKLFFVLVLVGVLAHEARSQEAKNESQICYDGIGCFSTSSPWVSVLRPIPKPMSPDEIATKIFYYTNANASREWNITIYPKIDLNGAPYNESLPTYFVTHGFGSNGHKDWVQEIKDGILSSRYANVFIVSWEKGSNNVILLQAIANTMVVGREVGMLIAELLQNSTSPSTSKRGLSLFGFRKRKTTSQKDQADSFTLIGHSLGAHISAYAAKYVRSKLHVKIGCIIALDPAQTLFEFYDPKVRLAKTDALSVIAVHTSAKPLLAFGMGMIGPVGHADFYMNGGFEQPGCVLPESAKLLAIQSPMQFLTFPVEQLKEIVSCPHGRSHRYFAEAVNNRNCTFWGHKVSAKKMRQAVENLKSSGTLSPIMAMHTKCTHRTCAPLDLDTASYSHHGSFIVFTTGIAPFCIPEEGILGVLKRNRDESAKAFASQTNQTVEAYQKRIKELEKENEMQNEMMMKLINPAEGLKMEVERKMSEAKNSEKQENP